MHKTLVSTPSTSRKEEKRIEKENPCIHRAYDPMGEADN
jgi:hypothetical protein